MLKGQCGTDHAAWRPVCEACDTIGRIGWAVGPRAAAVEPKVVPAPALAGLIA